MRHFVVVLKTRYILLRAGRTQAGGEFDAQVAPPDGHVGGTLAARHAAAGAAARCGLSAGRGTRPPARRPLLSPHARRQPARGAAIVS